MEPRIPTDFVALGEHIRKARLECSIALGESVARIAQALGRGIRGFLGAMQHGYEAECDRRAIEADAFLKRSVPRY